MFAIAEGFALAGNTSLVKSHLKMRTLEKDLEKGENSKHVLFIILYVSLMFTHSFETKNLLFTVVLMYLNELCWIYTETCNLMFQQEIVLVEGSRVFESWKTPPPPVYMEFFFFNVTNVDEVLTGAKPVVNQVGPYTYR